MHTWQITKRPQLTLCPLAHTGFQIPKRFLSFSSPLPISHRLRDPRRGAESVIFFLEKMPEESIHSLAPQENNMERNLAQVDSDGWCLINQYSKLLSLSTTPKNKPHLAHTNASDTEKYLNGLQQTAPDKVSLKTVHWNWGLQNPTK